MSDEVRISSWAESSPLPSQIRDFGLVGRVCTTTVPSHGQGSSSSRLPRPTNVHFFLRTRKHSFLNRSLHCIGIWECMWLLAHCTLVRLSVIMDWVLLSLARAHEPIIYQGIHQINDRCPFAMASSSEATSRCCQLTSSWSFAGTRRTGQPIGRQPLQCLVF